MTTSQVFVLLLGTGAIILVNWYFFLAGRGAADAATGGSGKQEATIIVRGGYSPAVIRAKPGVPLRLTFDRQETSSCSEEIVFPDFGIRQFLPAHQQTSVELTPTRPGTYDFTCGMSMLRGKLIVE